AEIVALGAERLELVGSGDLAEPALGRARREPGEEARQRRAVAAMGDARAIELGLVLARLRKLRRIGGAMDLRARRGEAVEHPGRRARRIDLDAPLGLTEAIECLAERLGRRHAHRVAEMLAETRREI